MGYYVYRLYCDPFVYNPCNIPDGTFYVGKGSGNRYTAHEAETKAKLKRGNLAKLSHKNKVILQAWDRGAKIYVMIIPQPDEATAFAVESEMITFYSLQRLTNVAYGRRPVAKKKRWYQK
jgi:hypothetical protein